MLALAPDERARADREAYGRLDLEQRDAFFRGRAIAGVPKGAPPHEGASMFAAGLASAYVALSEQWGVASLIEATPFPWAEPSQIPKREWVYNRHYIKKYLTSTTALSGIGKSSLALVEGISIATGKPLLDIRPNCQENVWYINGEDPISELQRRVMAVCMHYEIEKEELQGRFFVDSGRDTRIIVAEQGRNSASILRPTIDAIVKCIDERNIGVLIVDPLVAFHKCTENDNGAMEVVAQAFAEIAERGNCSVEAIHHSKKTGGAEVTVDDSRGASAVIAKTRSARAVNVMSEAEATKADVPNRRAYFRCENGKSSMTTPAEKAIWYRLHSVNLGNGSVETGGLDGDTVGVVVPWTWPEALEGVTVDDLRAVQAAVEQGRWRENAQSTNWVGKPIAEVLRLDAGNKAHRSKIAGLVKIWIGTGMLAIVTGKDNKGMDRSFVEVGERAT